MQLNVWNESKHWLGKSSSLSGAWWMTSSILKTDIYPSFSPTWLAISNIYDFQQYLKLQNIRPAFSKSTSETYTLDSTQLKPDLQPHSTVSYTHDTVIQETQFKSFSLKAITLCTAIVTTIKPPIRTLGNEVRDKALAKRARWLALSESDQILIRYWSDIDLRDSSVYRTSDQTFSHGL